MTITVVMTSVIFSKKSETEQGKQGVKTWRNPRRVPGSCSAVFTLLNTRCSLPDWTN